jgi:hypothetical protein
MMEETQRQTLQEYIKMFSKEQNYVEYATLLLIDSYIVENSFDQVRHYNKLKSKGY